MRPSLPLALCLLLSAGCATSHGTEPGLAPDVIIALGGISQPPPIFDVPAVVTAGVPFTVTYAVYGSSSCTQHDAPHVSLADGAIRITPRLRIIPLGRPCTDDLAAVRHSVAVRWETRTLALPVILIGLGADRLPTTVTKFTQVQ